MTGAASPAGAPRRRLPRAEREAQLLEVAEQVFAERGYAATTVDEVAERAGVTKPVVYDLFGSKAGLLAAGVQRGRAELLRVTTEAGERAGATGDAREVLRAGLLAFFRFVRDRGQVWAVLLEGGAGRLGAAVEEAVDAGRRQQAELTAAMLREVLPGADALAVEVEAQAVTGACERLAAWWTTQPHLTAEQLADRLTDALWPGLAALGAGAVPPVATAGAAATA